MATQPSVALNHLARAFLFQEGVDICNVKPFYFPCLSIDSLSQDFGDVTRIECPDPFNAGKFIEVAVVPGEISRMTTTLTTHMSHTQLSQFYRLAGAGCGFDLHLHFGVCVNPTVFNQYDKALVFEDVYVTSYGTDPLVALQSADRAVINETVDISIGRFYEVVPLSYTEQGTTVTANTDPLIDSVYVDTKSCLVGCGSFDGCQFLVAVSASGELIYTDDAGVEWTAPVTAMGATPAGIGYLSGSIWSYDSTLPAIYITNKENIIDGIASVPVSTGVIAGGVDQANGVSYGLVVGAAGLIALVESPDVGFARVYNGTLTLEDLTVVNFNSYTDDALIGGENNVLFYTNDGVNFEQITTPTAQATQTITAVYPVNDHHFLIGYGGDHELWCTSDGGTTWTQISFSGAVLNDDVMDITQTSRHVFWMAAGNQLWRSIDGGSTFIQQPASKKTFPTNTVINDILICQDNPNKVHVFGEDATAGFAAIGQAHTP